MKSRTLSVDKFISICALTRWSMHITYKSAHEQKKQCTSLWRNSILNMISVLLFFHWVCFSISLSLSLTLSLSFSLSLWINSDEYFPLFSYTKESHGNGSWFLFKYLNNMGFLSLMIRFEFDDPLKNTGDSVKFFIRSMENSWYIFFIFIITYHYGELNAKCKSIFTKHFSPEIHIRKCCLYVNFWSSLPRNTNIFHQIAYVIFSYWFNIFIHRLVRILYIFCFCIPTTHGTWDFFILLSQYLYTLWIKKIKSKNIMGNINIDLYKKKERIRNGRGILLGNEIAKIRSNVYHVLTLFWLAFFFTQWPQLFIQ